MIRLLNGTARLIRFESMDHVRTSKLLTVEVQQGATHLLVANKDVGNTQH